jgi:hypothetical protein
VSREAVIDYLGDLPELLEVASVDEKRTLLRSFIKGITREVGGATSRYRLPVTTDPRTRWSCDSS